MEITYAGGDSLRLKGERVVVINGDEAADVVLYGKRTKKRGQIVDGPGEYEIKDVMIETAAGPENSLAHRIRMDELSVAFVGTAARLETAAITMLEEPDVLLISADDLEAARALVTQLEPRVVVPFGERAAELCQALGVREPQAEARFSWNGTGAAPKAVLLKAARSRRAA